MTTTLKTKFMRMKKHFRFFFLSIMFLFCCFQCKKPDKPTTDIVLYDQPLKTIQKHIEGKWKFVYGKGGICSTCIHYCNNCYVEFTSNNKFIGNTFVVTSDTTTIYWLRDVGTYTKGDSTYLMTFKDMNGVPWVYVIDRIYNDTLIFYDNAIDAVFYHFIKSK